MKLEKEDNKLILTLPLWQNSYDASDEIKGQVPTIVGVVAGNEFSISHLIDLGYKDDVQEGSPIIMFETKEELTEVCNKLGLGIWEHPLCSECGAVIRGSHTLGEKGAICYQCD